MSKILLADGLVKSYDGRKVVDGVTFSVNPGEVVGLLGPNGAGKTTSFYMVVGLVRPDSGRVQLGDLELTDEPMYMRSRAGLAYLPQEASIFRKMTVMENILSVLEILPEYKSDRRKQLSRVRELIGELDLSKVASSKGFSLSGGERRRVEIARALACSPSFLLLDEPFAGIDPIVVGELQKLVRGLAAKGIGVLITDHNVRETLTICDRGYILSDGKVIEQGDPEHIANSEIARKYYLGENFKF